jgi:hypothetical protein
MRSALSALCLAIGVACVLFACAAPTFIRGRTTQVRVDISARALAQVRAELEAACAPLKGCDQTVPPWRELARAVSDAELWLQMAQDAGDRFARGDGRDSARVGPCLAGALATVADRLEDAKQAIPPGLVGVVQRGRDDVCQLELVTTPTAL